MNGTLRANGAGDGPPRSDKQPLVVRQLTSHDISPTLDTRAWHGPRRHQDAPMVMEEAVAQTLTAHHDRIDPSSQTYVPLGVDVAGTLQAHRGAGGGGLSPDETLVPVAAPELADTLTAGGHPNSAVPGRHKEDDSNLVAGTLRSHPRPGSASPGALTAFNVVPEGGQGADLRATEVDIAPAVQPQTGSYDRGVHLAGAVGVRRLTPVECERLMGWPDGYTAPAGVKAPDTKRYAACGDGVVANVSEWIGRRIIALEAGRG